MNTKTGEPILTPFKVLQDTETHIRRGQLTLIAGGPGTGKSALIHAIIQRGNDRGDVNTCFYFSADSDPYTMWKRSASIATGYMLTDVEEMVRNKNVDGLDAQVDKAAEHMRWRFDSSPSEDDILLQVQAYEEVYGEYPEIIVTDNLKNIWQEGGEFEALEQTCMFLHELARDTNAAVVALHHVTGENENGDKPIPLSGLRGKVSKTPEVVLTLHRQPDGLNISPVKNRNGRAQADGNWFMPLRADLSRMSYSG